MKQVSPRKLNSLRELDSLTPEKDVILVKGEGKALLRHSPDFYAWAAARISLRTIHDEIITVTLAYSDLSVREGELVIHKPNYALEQSFIRKGERGYSALSRRIGGKN